MKKIDNYTSLCRLSGAEIKDNLELFKQLISDGRYYCKKCGRVAHLKSNLCKPSSINEDEE